MIKKFNIFEGKSQFYSDNEIKDFISLSRKIMYHLDKYLGDKFSYCSWTDNKYPIHLIIKNYIMEDKSDRNKRSIHISAKHADVNKLNFIFKALKKCQKYGDDSYLLTKEQAEKFLSDAKIKFYNYEIEEVTSKYNL